MTNPSVRVGSNEPCVLRKGDQFLTEKFLYLKVQSCMSNLSRIRTVSSIKHGWRISISKLQSIFLGNQNVVFCPDRRQFLFIFVKKCFLKKPLEQILCSGHRGRGKKSFDRTRAKLFPSVSIGVRFIRSRNPDSVNIRSRTLRIALSHFGLPCIASRMSYSECPTPNNRIS